MSKKSAIYITGIVLLLILFMALLSKNEESNWTRTFNKDDKKPYGAYALSELLEEDENITDLEQSNLTLYELDLLEEDKACLLVISSYFSPDQESLEDLMDFVRSGGNAIISSEFFPLDFLEDSLDLELSFVEIPGFQKRSDSLKLSFNGEDFYFYQQELGRCFVDSTGDKNVLGYSVDQANTIEFSLGEGHLVLNTTPIIFTNYFLLHGNNNRASDFILPYMQGRNVLWTEYYQSGRDVNYGMFAAFAEHRYLKLSLRFGLILILLFILFEAKRKRAAIPIVSALKNQTLDFINILRDLYLNTSSDKQIALMRIHYLKDFILQHYNLHWNDSSEFTVLLSAKSGHPIEMITQLTQIISHVNSNKYVDDESFNTLNVSIDNFYKKDL